MFRHWFDRSSALFGAMVDFILFRTVRPDDTNRNKRLFACRSTDHYTNDREAGTERLDHQNSRKRQKSTYYHQFRSRENGLKTHNRASQQHGSNFITALLHRRKSNFISFTTKNKSIGAEKEICNKLHQLKKFGQKVLLVY